MKRNLWIFREGKFLKSVQAELLPFREKSETLFFVKGVKFANKPLIVYSITVTGCPITGEPGMPTPVIVIDYDDPDTIPELVAEMYRLGELAIGHFDDDHARKIASLLGLKVRGAVADLELESKHGHNKIVICGMEIKPQGLVKTTEHADGSKTYAIGCAGIAMVLGGGFLLMIALLFFKFLFW